jgi:hypothetical protein
MYLCLYSRSALITVFAHVEAVLFFYLGIPSKIQVRLMEYYVSFFRNLDPLKQRTIIL